MEGTALITTKMFKPKPTDLEEAIVRLFVELETHQPNTVDYDKVSEQLVKLYKLKEVDSKKRVSPDALIAALTNVAGILVIVNFEHAHALTSKAISFVMKTK